MEEWFLKLHKVSSSGFVQHRNDQLLSGFGLFEFCLWAQTRALLASHFLAEMAEMVKRAKKWGKSKLSSSYWKMQSCLVSFSDSSFGLCRIHTSSSCDLCQSSEGSPGGSKRKTAPAVPVPGHYCLEYLCMALGIAQVTIVYLNEGYWGGGVHPPRGWIPPVQHTGAGQHRPTGMPGWDVSWSRLAAGSSPTSCSVEPLPGKYADVQKPGMEGPLSPSKWELHSCCTLVVFP